MDGKAQWVVNGALHGPGLIVAHVSAADFPLAKVQSLCYTSLQGRLTNSLFMWSQKFFKRPSLVLWLAVLEYKP